MLEIGKDSVTTDTQVDRWVLGSGILCDGFILCGIVQVTRLIRIHLFFLLRFPTYVQVYSDLYLNKISKLYKKRTLAL